MLEYHRMVSQQMLRESKLSNFSVVYFTRSSIQSLSYKVYKKQKNGRRQTSSFIRVAGSRELAIFCF